MKKQILAALAILVFGLGLTPAFAGDYPDKPVHVIFPNKAGGGYHTILLTMKPYLEKGMSVPLVVQAMPGAGTVTGDRFVADQPADGYTLLFIHEALLQAGAMGTLGFAPLDKLQPIAQVARSCPATYARADAPYSNLKELAEYAKANPGKVRAGVNVGALSHVEMLALGQRLGYEPRIVSAGGGAGVRQAILSGDADIGDQNPSAVASLVKAGQLKALAYYGDERSSYLPDTPTMAEQGYETPSAMCNSAYFWIRRDTPQNVKDYWTKLLKTRLMAAETKATLEKQLGVQILFVGGKEMDKLGDKLWNERKSIVDTFGLRVQDN